MFWEMSGQWMKNSNVNYKLFESFENALVGAHRNKSLVEETELLH